MYKDEVRSLAEYLEVSVSQRQPFPGPGLAVRVMGEATPERTEVVRQACHIAEEEIELAAKDGLMDLPWQYFAVVLPVKTVGVQGDVRAYGNTIAVRAVHSYDAMTAQAAEIPYSVLKKISERITRELKSQVNRVVYDITDKPPGTMSGNSGAGGGFEPAAFGCPRHSRNYFYPMSPTLYQAEPPRLEHVESLGVLSLSSVILYIKPLITLKDECY